jgi:putative transposase
MPRTARASQANYCYHVLNRGNGQARVFHKPGDYEAFVALFERGCERLPMRILAYCLMPNHFHLVLWPRKTGDLGRFMQWLLTAHVRRYHRHYHTSGHVWQGRFKAFPIEQDEHLLTVLRYVERNPLRAGLVKAAEEWKWSSLGLFTPEPQVEWLHAGPAPRGRDWRTWVNQPQNELEVIRLRQSIARGTPFGSDGWVKRAAKRLGLEASLHPRGRPRKPGYLSAVSNRIKIVAGTKK